MARSKWLFYDQAKVKLLNGEFDLNSLQMRMALYKNTSVSISLFSATTIAQIGNPVNSAGYKGRYTLTPVTAEPFETSSGKFSIGSIVFTATGGDITSVQYALIYESLSGNLLCWCRLSTSAFNITSRNTLTIGNASGVFHLTGGTEEYSTIWDDGGTVWDDGGTLWE